MSELRSKYFLVSTTQSVNIKRLSIPDIKDSPMGTLCVHLEWTGNCSAYIVYHDFGESTWGGGLSTWVGGYFEYIFTDICSSWSCEFPAHYFSNCTCPHKSAFFVFVKVIILDDLALAFEKLTNQKHWNDQLCSHVFSFL